jgi:hypothetical protein
MVKVFWLIKRAPEISVEEFERWWLEKHGPDVIQWQGAKLRKYTLRFPVPYGTVEGASKSESGWDGIAEQWFDDVDEYNSAGLLVPSDEMEEVRRYFGEVRGFAFNEFELIADESS